MHWLKISLTFLILSIFRELLLRNEKFRVNICFETNIHSVETVDINCRVTAKALSTAPVLYFFKLVLYFNSVATSDQIKYYLTTNRRNFSADAVGLLQVCFADSVWLFLCCWKRITKKSR